MKIFYAGLYKTESGFVRIRETNTTFGFPAKFYTVTKLMEFVYCNILPDGLVVLHCRCFADKVRVPGDDVWCLGETETRDFEL